MSCSGKRILNESREGSQMMSQQSRYGSPYETSSPRPRCSFGNHDPQTTFRRCISCRYHKARFVIEFGANSKFVGHGRCVWPNTSIHEDESFRLLKIGKYVLKPRIPKPPTTSKEMIAAMTHIHYGAYSAELNLSRTVLKAVCKAALDWAPIPITEYFPLRLLPSEGLRIGCYVQRSG